MNFTSMPILFIYTAAITITKQPIFLHSLFLYSQENGPHRAHWYFVGLYYCGSFHSPGSYRMKQIITLKARQNYSLV